MGHNPATRDGKPSHKAAVETRTPDQRLADIRKNRAAKLFVTPDDQDFLLASLEVLNGDNILQRREIADLNAQVATLTALQAEITQMKSFQTFDAFGHGLEV